eukprot:875745-Rhodomonas_salina.1
MMINKHHVHKHEALTENNNTKGHQQVKTFKQSDSKLRLNTCSLTQDNTLTGSSDSTLAH